jgi:hypothetical protein
MLLYCVALLLRGVILHVDRGGQLRALLGRAVRASLRGCIAPLLLAIPVGLSLMQQRGWIYAVGIQAPDQNLIPTLPAFAGYGTAVFFGWLTHREPAALPLIQRRWPVYLGLALAATALLFYGIHSTHGPSREVGSRLIYALTQGIAAWGWTFAITGAALSFCAGYSPMRRYMADASYWMYLAHLPLVLAIGMLLGHWRVHWAIKYPLTLCIAFAALLISYQYLVRPTFIGRQLNGRRSSIRPIRPLTPSGAPPPSATPSGSA